MKYRVLIGSVRTEMGSVFPGGELELTEKEGNNLIREGVVELVVEKQSQVSQPEEKEPLKEVTQPSKKPRGKGKKEVEAKPLAEPSMDWTMSELLDYAKEKEIEVPLDATKEQVLEAISEGEEK